MSPHHPTSGPGSAINSPSGVAEMDFMHILGQKEAIWDTIFSIIERRGAPKRRGARENFPLPLSKGLYTHALSPQPSVGRTLAIAKITSRLGTCESAVCIRIESRIEYFQLKRILITTRNTLDCDQSNYSSRIVSPTYLLNLVKPELAPFDPPTPKTPQ